MTPTRSVLLLASGGMDSTTLAYWLLDQGYDITPAFINYGHHSAATEHQALLKLLPSEIKDKLRVIEIKGVFERSNSAMIQERDLWSSAISDDDLYVAYRNQLILTLGAALASELNIAHLYSAFISGNVAKGADCTTLFLRNLSQIAASTGGIQMHFPFLEYSKLDVARIGLNVGAPISETYSCLARATTPCGSCPNCVDRNEAFAALQNEIISPEP